jgi:RHS repeat-associated protein
MSVDDVAYSWDANGDLLSDGYRTYTYDHAGRLSSFVLGADTYEFNYNGLGDRLQQIVNGVASYYTLDIETGLTQVLSDGEEAFLYGVGRIAQQGPSSRSYFLEDALNSTRQLVDDTGRIGLGRAYEPFGDLLLVTGELETSYGFAGEWTDATGLIHLRARYYQPTDGRFVQPDPFAGIPTQPISQNPYPFAYDSPFVYTDASGRNPLLATIITGAALGGIIGTVGGYVFARLIYNWSYRGECNCEMQQWALSVNGTKWIAKATLLAGAIGFIAGGLAVAAPIGEIVVGLVGYTYATYDLSVLMTKVYTRWQATAEFGFTKCELLRFVVDVVGIIGGALLASKGFVDLQASGSLLEWAPFSPSLSGRKALGDLYARSRLGRGWDVREMPGENAEVWFRKIAIKIKPHHIALLREQGALEGLIPGGGRIQYRPITASNPAIDTFEVPGYSIDWKYHFPPAP